MYKLRLAAETEAFTAMNLIDQAKAFLKEQGIDQWQKGYPDLACIQNDLACRKGYFVVNEEGCAAAYLCVDFDGEPAYETLSGAWLTGDKACYAVVHRMAVDRACRGQGIAGQAFLLVQALCEEKGVSSIRVDTDEDNAIMRHIIEKNGFS